MEFDQIVAIKEQTLPALTSTVITAKYKGKVSKEHNYIASIFSPKTPMILGMPAIVSIDKNNNCKIILDNCAPYDVTISRNDILCIMDTEPDEPIPMEDSTIRPFYKTLRKSYPKCQNVNLQEMKLLLKLTLMFRKNSNKSTLTFCISTSRPSASTSTT